MRIRFGAALLAVGLFPPAPAGAQSPRDLVAGVRSGAAVATIESVRPAPVVDGRPGITGGSGVAVFEGRAYVAQDDSTMLAVVNADGTTEAVRLFPPVAGLDRFLDELGNKKAKPDIEVIFALPAGSAAPLGGVFGGPRRGPLLVAMGSGSVAGTRDRVAVVAPARRAAGARVATLEARGLYGRLRAEGGLTGPGGQLNIEGAAVVRGGTTLRLFQRGTARGAAVASADVALGGFLRYLAAALRDPDAPFTGALSNVRRYDLGTAPSGSPVAVTDATAARDARGRETLLLSAVAEDTADVTLDGAVSGTTIGIHLEDGRLLLAPLMEAGRPSALKVEGLAVRSVGRVGARTRFRLVGVIDPDATDPHVPSKIAEIVVEY